jgi:hypothetical protein
MMMGMFSMMMMYDEDEDEVAEEGGSCVCVCAAAETLLGSSAFPVIANCRCMLTSDVMSR